MSGTAGSIDRALRSEETALRQAIQISRQEARLRVTQEANQDEQHSDEVQQAIRLSLLDTARSTAHNVDRVASPTPIPPNTPSVAAGGWLVRDVDRQRAGRNERFERRAARRAVNEAAKDRSVTLQDTIDSQLGPTRSIRASTHPRLAFPEVCAICQEAMGYGEELVACNRCRHLCFVHVACMDKYLAVAPLNAKCTRW